jgi:signal transduction histidine kinase
MGFKFGNIQDMEGSRPGLGIKNMYNRALLVGANFSMPSELGQGTTVSIHLPIRIKKAKL